MAAILKIFQLEFIAIQSTLRDLWMTLQNHLHNFGSLGILKIMFSVTIIKVIVFLNLLYFLNGMFVSMWCAATETMVSV